MVIYNIYLGNFNEIIKKLGLQEYKYPFSKKYKI